MMRIFPIWSSYLEEVTVCLTNSCCFGEHIAEFTLLGFQAVHVVIYILMCSVLFYSVTILLKLGKLLWKINRCCFNGFQLITAVGDKLFSR